MQKNTSIMEIPEGGRSTNYSLVLDAQTIEGERD
jgi:hypothetical protein